MYSGKTYHAKNIHGIHRLCWFFRDGRPGNSSLHFSLHHSVYVECECHLFHRWRITISEPCWTAWSSGDNREKVGWQSCFLSENLFETQDYMQMQWWDTVQRGLYRWHHGTAREIEDNIGVKYRHQSYNKWEPLVESWRCNCSLSNHYAIPKTFPFHLGSFH